MADDGRRPGEARVVPRRRQGALDRPCRAVRVRGREAALDTLSLRNGKHMLEVRAYGSKSWTRQRFVVRVKNEAFTLAPVDLKTKQQVSGVVPVRAVFTGVPPARVLLYLDGRQIDHDTSAPYLFKWDTRRTTDGLHTVTLAGRARDGRIVRSRCRYGWRTGCSPRSSSPTRSSTGRPCRAASTGSSRRAGASHGSSSSSTESCADGDRGSLRLRLGHERRDAGTARAARASGRPGRRAVQQALTVAVAPPSGP